MSWGNDDGQRAAFDQDRPGRGDYSPQESP